jgi:hypothetical protein
MRFLSDPIASKARVVRNISLQLPAPVGGLNAIASVMAMPPKDAVVLENWLPYPDRLQMRLGAIDHKTGSGQQIERLYNYTSPTGIESLWATTDTGVYNVTAAGAWPAAAIALTNGTTIGSILSTGASNYLTIVNGTDTAKQYDGTNWTSIATFGATATSNYSYIETYRQRYYLITKNSMTLSYLGPNSISGAVTDYNLGSVFRRGGYLVALGTWTIDGGTGPDDHLVIVTNQGEVAVFTGSDPGSLATWVYKGTYFIGRPLGPRPLFKYGGDLLFLCENGLFPLSKALLVATIDRTQSISRKIGQLFNDAGMQFFGNEGWEIMALPDTPLIIVNVPATPVRYQFCMHVGTGAWTIFSGWSALTFARLGGTLYFGAATKVVRVGGGSDFGANITATMLQAYTTLGGSRNKKIEEIRPIFESNGPFSYQLGVAPDFQPLGQTNFVTSGLSGSAAIWGTSVWGAATWTNASFIERQWRSVPDVHSVWKALYIQVSSNTATVQYLGADILANASGAF